MDTNRDHTKPTGPGRRLSRGEFLGVGAAAAAGVATGAATGSPAAGEEGCGTPQEQCVKPTLCGPDAGLIWSVSASVLQILWGEIFPRFVAYRWRQSPMRYPSPLPAAAGEVSIPDLIQAIHTYIHELPAGAKKAACVTSGGTPFCDLSVPDLTPFEHKARMVIDGLQAAQSAGLAVPIRILGVGGFDFILSDAGLDLFAPRRPVDPAELLRFYEMREPGRPAFGIPGYLDEADAMAFDVHAPTGPSQIWIDDQGFAATPVNLGRSCFLETLRCLFAEDIEPEVRRESNWVRPPAKKFTIPGLFAALAPSRCWQLEGAVYRGILEQLPRVVATVWREEVTGCTGPQSYHARFHTVDKMREIFEERMETMLPPPDAMVFRTPQGSEPDIADITVSNQGILFPRAGSCPPLDSMFAAIAQGRAGNPVFTDSKRPDREG